jgi:hypothetical protein
MAAGLIDFGTISPEFTQFTPKLIKTIHNNESFTMHKNSHARTNRL